MPQLEAVGDPFLLQGEAESTQMGPAAFPSRAPLRVQTFFTALTLAFGLLHLILFFFLLEQRSNLYYSLFLFLFAASIFFDFQELVLPEGADHEAFQRWHRLTFGLSLIFALRFFYELFLDRLPRRFWGVAAALVALSVLAAFRPAELFWPLQLLAAGALLEGIRVTLRAYRAGRPGAWMIGVGFLVFVLFASYDLLLDFGLMAPLAGVLNAYQFGMLGLFTATSALLAQDITRTRERLLEQERRARREEVERRLLEAEVARKTKELEEARALQLSMLPEAFPPLPGFEIAARMQTATEVGGDYYDFRKASDGAVTVAIGDATGHGLRAGIMVALAKSLFQGAALGEDLPGFFERCTRILKGMDLGNLFMSMTLVRIEGNTLTVSAAGMPPMLIFRAGSGEVEELLIKGMPLGAFSGFPYREVQTRLVPGDTVLLMTDGFVELFNEERQMLGLERARRILQQASGRPPEEVIAHLTGAAASWRRDAPQEDDMTFVVLRAKPLAD